MVTLKQVGRRAQPLLSAGILLAALLLSACGGLEESATGTPSAATSTTGAAAEASATTQPAATSAPTETPAPTNTPAPTSTPEPTNTPEPPTATPEPTASPTPVPPTATATPVPPPTPTTLNGSGMQLTGAVPLSQGLGVFKFNHNGGGNFIIWLYDAGTGEQVDLLVNEIGPWQGRRAIEIPAGGDYVFEVTAGGDWAIEVIQPTPLNWQTVNAPYEVSGSGSDVVLFVHLDSGLRRVTATHDGSANFIVWVYNSDASGSDLLFNEIGPVNGSTGLEVGDDGVYAVFDIQADGNWTLKVE